MKKYIVILVLCLTASLITQKANAQITMYKSTSTIAGITSAVADTVTGTATTYFSTKTGVLNTSTVANYKVTFQVDTTVYSSAPTVNVYLQGSMDGTTWYRLNNSPTGTDGVNCDTLNSATFTMLTQQMTATKGALKYVYGATFGSAASKSNYVRIVVSHSGAGTSTRIYNVKLYTFN